MDALPLIKMEEDQGRTNLGGKRVFVKFEFRHPSSDSSRQLEIGV